MTIVVRSMTQADIDPVVGLLKASLGERLMPKSVEFWNWKHVSNPFGPSPALVAEDNGQLIAVRAFMQWRWRLEGRDLRALRAVDTAVHPDAQGKGLFSKMTKQLVDESIDKGYDFIFNTPNAASGAGYLKLGWREAGKTQVRMRLTLFGSGAAAGKPVTDLTRYPEKLDQLLTAHLQANSSFMVTAADRDYIQWRYANAPVASYQLLHDLDGDGTFLIIFRIKQHKYFREGRLVEAFLDPARVNLIALKRAFKGMGTCEVLTVTPSMAAEALFGKLGFLPALPLGPMVATRELTLKNPELLESFSIWKPALGDLELF